jgi:hypothetical protein
MKALRNPVVVFFVAMLVIAGILFFVPLNLFDGEILMKGTTTWIPWKLSLSNFIGIGTEDAASQGVADFRLVGMGYVLAGLLILAFPLLIAYRVRLANEQEARKKKGQ